MWSETPGKLWKVGETAEGGARENPAFPPFFRLAVASIRRCCTCVPGVFDQMLAGFTSERWPPSFLNGGRLHVGIPGRIESESAAETRVPDTTKALAEREAS